MEEETRAMKARRREVRRGGINEQEKKECG